MKTLCYLLLVLTVVAAFICTFLIREAAVKRKAQIVFDLLLITTALTICLYQFSMQRLAAYAASIVAVCGSAAFLVRDILALTRSR